MTRKKSDPHPRETQSEIQGVLHIRRCHVCGAVNEVKDQALLKCTHCGRLFPPYYFFEENIMDALPDNGFYYSTWKRSETYNPIWGVSVYWPLT